MEGSSTSMTSAGGFQSKLSQLIDVQTDRDMLYKSLKDYQLNHEVSNFVDSLKTVIIHPVRLALFDDVRPFIQPSQQTLFDQLIPSLPGKKMRRIQLVRQGSENLGFAVRGGVEFNVGVHVSEVTPQSLAARKGLKVGDEIVGVNGYNISQATHSEVISALTTNKTLMLKVRSVGMLPMKNTRSDPVTWEFVTDGQRSLQDDSGLSNDQVMKTDRKVFVNLQSGKKLGCGIGTGQNNEPGIFVFKINPGSLAETLNFKIGDQIIDVNGTSFLYISHDVAVMELKSSSQLTITLRSKEGKDEVRLPLEKSRSLLVGVDVSPIPKQPSLPSSVTSASVHTPEMGENLLYQDKTSEEQGVQTADDVDTGKSQLSSNWSVKSKKRLDKDGKAGEKDNVEKSQLPPKSKPVKGSSKTQPQAWWSKDSYSLFTHRQIDGRKLCKVEIQKDMPLEMLIEGGIQSPLAGRVVISEIYAGGAAERSGELFKGDQLMMVDGKSMIDISINAAQDILKEAMANLDGTEVMRLITAMSPVKNYEDELTFF